MITIKETNNNSAELHIDKGTSGTTLLLGIEMLVEAAVKDTGISIDNLLGDVKFIYERDNVKNER